MLIKEKEFLINTYHRIVSDVQAEALYKKYLHSFENTLYFKNTPIDTDPKGRLVLAGSGKASLNMGTSFLPYLNREADNSLFISTSEASDAPFSVIEGDHPTPQENSLRAGKAMHDLIQSLNDDDTLIYFLSGGSSSLMELPVNGLNIDDLQHATKCFLSLGLNIGEINTLRAALSQVKAGKLADKCKANCYVFVLSDVMGNDLSIIGSGPFHPSKATPAGIREIIEKYELKDHLSPDMINLLQSYEPSNTKHNIPHFLIGSNMDLLQAAETACFDHEITPLTFPESLFGEASEAGRMIADMLRLYSGKTPVCMIFGGETTVTLNDKPGKGGRAQELALSVLRELKDSSGIFVLSSGSDGMDGVGGGAGAIVSAETYKNSIKLKLSIEDHLHSHDSYHFHEKCGSLIKTGYSGTNIGDVVIGLIVDG